MNAFVNVALNAIGGQSSGPTAISYGTKTSVSFSGSVIQTLALSGNTTLAFSGVQPGNVVILDITSSGAYTVSWPATAYFAGGTTPTMTSSGEDIYTILCLSASKFVVTAVQAIAT